MELISIKSQLGGVVAAGALGVAAMAGFIAPASAAQAASATARPTAAGPKTDIVGSPAKWVPNKLTVKPVTGKCSATNNSFSGTNKTAKPQTVLVMGKAVTTLKPGKVKYVCLPSSAKGATIKASLKSSGAVLTIKVS
jgi:hypothetical protein